MPSPQERSRVAISENDAAALLIKKYPKITPLKSVFFKGKYVFSATFAGEDIISLFSVDGNTREIMFFSPFALDDPSEFFDLL